MKTKIPLSCLMLIIFASACSDGNYTADAYGNFETQEIIVSAQAQGKLCSFTIEEGQDVEAGQFVGLIDTIQLTLTRQQFQAQFQASRANIESINQHIKAQQEKRRNLEQEVCRVRKLRQDQAATARELDQLTGQRDVLDANIAAMRSKRDGARYQSRALQKQIDQVSDKLKRCQIVNPIEGTVLAKYVATHELVTPGKPLFKIADLSIMILRVYISGAQLSQVELGQSVTVLIDHGTDDYHRLPGKVTWISDQAEFTPKTIQTKAERVNLVYAVKVQVKNDGKIKIGMPGEILF